LSIVTDYEHCFWIDGFDRDDCYHDEDGESIDEDNINEIRTIYNDILEKKLPTYPYENYPDLSLGEFISEEFDQYLQLKKLTIEKDEINQKEKVIDWLSKQHPYLNTIGCEKLTDVSVQGKIFCFNKASRSSIYTKLKCAIDDAELSLVLVKLVYRYKFLNEKSW
jgi:hypothetical protein